MIIEYIMNALAPYICFGCGTEGDLLCSACQLTLPHCKRVCSICDTSVPKNLVCTACCKRNNINAVFAATPYKLQAKQLIHALKFERAKAAADTIAAIMTTRIPMGAVLIVHMPTAASRVRQRGYDQAELIARACAQKAHLPHYPLLMRIGHQRQLGKTREARKRQLQDVFYVRPSDIPVKQPILLIDDVITTGSSISAAALSLRRAGYADIQAAVFAAA